MSAASWGPADFEAAKALVRQFHGHHFHWHCTANCCQCNSLGAWLAKKNAENEMAKEAIPAPDFSLPPVLKELANCRFPVIGLSGRKRSGKDTISATLKLHHYRNDSYARPLKLAVQTIYGWDDRHTDGDLKEIVDPYWGTTPRKVMQLFGTEVGRSIDRFVWLKSLHKRVLTDIELRSVLKFADVPLRFVITDVRFPNEGDMIRAMGGVVWRVERPGFSPNDPGLHASETAMDDYPFDDVLINDGKIEDLAQKVEEALKGTVAMSSGNEFPTPNGIRRLRAAT